MNGIYHQVVNSVKAVSNCADSDCEKNSMILVLNLSKVLSAGWLRNKSRMVDAVLQSNATTTQ